MRCACVRACVHVCVCVLVQLIISLQTQSGVTLTHTIAEDSSLGAPLVIVTIYLTSDGVDVLQLPY
jgi:hypothetical protein